MGIIRAVMEHSDSFSANGFEAVKENSLLKIWQLTPTDLRPKFIYFIIFALFGTALEVIGIGLLVPLINLLTAETLSEGSSVLQPVFSILGTQSQTQMLLVGLLTISSLVLIKNLYFVFLSFYKFNLTSKIRASLENQILSKHLGSNYELHIRTNSSVMIRNITSEVDQVIDNVLVPLLSMSVEICVVIGLTTLLMFVEPLATLSLIIFFCVCGFTYTKTIGPILTKYGAERAKLRAKLIQNSAEVFGGFKEIKLLGRETYFRDSFRHNTEKASRVSVIANTLQSLPILLVELWGMLGLVLVILVMIFNQHISYEIVSILGLFVGASFRFLPSLNRILVAINGLRHVSTSIDTVHREILNQDGSEIDKRSSLQLQDSLEFKNVSFSYAQNPQKVLDNLTFTIHFGEMLGIFGPSGSGKSTFVDVLLGLLTPTAGEVIADGTVVDLFKSTWRSQAGYVPQEIYILDDTIRNNIAFGIKKDLVSDERIMVVSKLAQIDNFIYSLDQGLDTNISERGSRLSGGQKQRIGIARALYSQPSLLVLDEPTSALDVDSEMSFTQSLQSIRGNTTVIIISHKESTLRYCDRILSILDGKMV